MLYEIYCLKRNKERRKAGKKEREMFSNMILSTIYETAALVTSFSFSDFEMDKIAWQKKSRPPSGFATINPKNPKKKIMFFLSKFMNINY